MVGAWHTMATTIMARPSGWDFPLLWATLPLVGALLLAAAIIAAAKKWRRRSGLERLTATEQLAHFRSLYERGELSEEEYARVRARLGERLKQEMALPAVPAAETPPSPPASEPTSLREDLPNGLPTPPREHNP